MNSIHRSILFSALERYGSLVFFVIATAILSRLLTPQEFGIYAVVGALTTVAAASFQEFGGANYLIQKTSLSERDVRTAFTITLCLAALLAVAVFEFRDIAAWFYSDEGLKAGIAVSALNFLLSPFSMTISALMRRDMLFGTLARCNLAGNFVNAAASIALAALGYSFMAPILGTLVGNAAVLALLIASRGDLRIFLPSFRGYRDVIGFGAYSSSTVIINVFYNLAPQLILARVLGFDAVGLYSRAITVTQVLDRSVIQVLNPVIMPAIVAHTRTGNDLKGIYLRLHRVDFRRGVAFFGLCRADGGTDCVDLVRPDLDRNRSAYSDVVHCVSFSVRGVPDVSSFGCRRQCPRYSRLIINLAAALTPFDFCCFIFRATGRRGFRPSSPALPGYCGALFYSPAPRNEPSRSYERYIEKRYCYGLQYRRCFGEHGYD